MDVIKDFQIYVHEDYMTFTTDAASNIIKCVTENLDRRSIKCFAYMLNTILKKSMLKKKHKLM